jgi:hypothetical protein
MKHLIKPFHPNLHFWYFVTFYFKCIISHSNQLLKSVDLLLKTTTYNTFSLNRAVKLKFIYN